MRSDICRTAPELSVRYPYIKAIRRTSSGRDLSFTGPSSPRLLCIYFDDDDTYIMYILGIFNVPYGLVVYFVLYIQYIHIKYANVPVYMCC